MIVILGSFALLCIGAVFLGMSPLIGHFGLKFNAILIAVAVGIVAWWRYIEWHSPPTSIAGHWEMVSISLLGFLAMLLSTVAALKRLAGIQAGVIVISSIVIGVVHLLDMLVSMPVS